MTRDEHKAIVNQLLTMASAEQQANASNLLTQLTEDYEQTLTGLEQATANVTTLTANNETLREVNAKLFLKVGQTDKNPNPNTEDPNKDNNENQLKFEDLFDEKGVLK